MTSEVLQDVPDFFKARATLLVPLMVLNETSARLGTLINSAILGVGVSDLENRSKIDILAIYTQQLPSICKIRNA